MDRRGYVAWLLLAITVACAKAPTAPPRPNIVLVTIDTFRADRLGAGITPALDRLSASGVRFTAARTAVPLTLPSHTTIMTGLLPPAHGVRENGVDVLSDAHPTVARLLKNAGYSTAAFVGAFVLDHRFGLSQGFDTYDDRIARDADATDRLEAERPADQVVNAALTWLERTRAQEPGPDQAPGTSHRAPFFVWIHLYDPHSPYEPPARFRERTRSPYDGEIAFADEQIARVFEWLRAHGDIERTLIVVSGDHGEGLGDHGERTHGMLLYDSTLRVPLIVASPGRQPAVRTDAVSLVDIAPTILRAAGVASTAGMKGRDLLAAVRLTPDQDLYSETEYPRVLGWSPLQALTDGRWMTIRAGAATEVYDMQADPLEQHNVASAQASVAAAMSARAQALHGSTTPTNGRVISSEAQERLRSLGYVASSVQPTVGSDAPNPAARIATWNAFEGVLTALETHQPGALAAVRQLATDNPNAPVIQMTLARALKEGGHTTAALAAYREAARRWPTDAALLHDLATTAREAAAATTGAAAKALHDEAVRADQAALTIDPNNAPAQNAAGLLAADVDDGRAAVTAFERATELDSNNASYWSNLGNARRTAADRAGAAQAYRRALDVDPRNLDAANGLGVLMVEDQRPADAIALFERVLGVQPDLTEARLNLGIALQANGQPARAVEEYRRVLAAHGNHAREKDAAAKLLAALGAAR